METPNALSEQRSTRRPSRRKYKVASQGNSPVRPSNVWTPSSAPGVTYNKTTWHVPSTRSNAAPTPALARLQDWSFAYIITLWRYHGPRGRGTTTIDPECGSTTPGAHKCATLFLFSFFLPTRLRSPEALSGSRPAELTMQQPGKEKGCDVYPGGLPYEHLICFIHHAAAYPWRGTLSVSKPADLG